MMLLVFISVKILTHGHIQKRIVHSLGQLADTKDNPQRIAAAVVYRLPAGDAAPVADQRYAPDPFIRAHAPLAFRQRPTTSR